MNRGGGVGRVTSHYWEPGHLGPVKMEACVCRRRWARSIPVAAAQPTGTKLCSIANRAFTHFLERITSSPQLHLSEETNPLC
jgi:hypothetical protein